MRTRSKATTKAGSTKKTESEPVAPIKSLSPSVADPPKIFILPKKASPEARIVTLPNPATSTPIRYFFCPESGFYEFTKIAAPKRTPRSWLVAKCGDDRASDATLKKDEKAPEVTSKYFSETETPGRSNSFSDGYILKSPQLFLATPVDDLFIILPVVAPASKSKKHSKSNLLLSLDDHLDNLDASCSTIRQFLRQPKLRARVEKRLAAVCDTTQYEGDDEVMYRLSRGKFLKEMLRKAQRMTQNGLPSSLEEKFIRNALEAPAISIKREENIPSATATDDADDATAAQQTETQTSADSERGSQPSTQSFMSTSTAATSVAPEPEAKESLPLISAPEGVPELLRLRTALKFIASSYLPPNLRLLLQAVLEESALVDFGPLDAHLKHIAELKSQAQALRALSDNISGKRSAIEDEDAAEARAIKKRKKEEEDKKRKTESRSTKELRKVDKTGMKKLSAFFTKLPAKKS